MSTGPCVRRAVITAAHSFNSYWHVQLIKLLWSILLTVSTLLLIFNPTYHQQTSRQGNWKPFACSVAKECLTLWDPVDCSPPGSSVHGIYQARILEWVAISSSRGSSRLRDQNCISCIDGILYHWVTWEDRKHFKLWSFLLPPSLEMWTVRVQRRKLLDRVSGSPRGGWSHLEAVVHTQARQRELSWRGIIALLHREERCARLCGTNIPTMAGFKLPVWSHWVWS